MLALVMNVLWVVLFGFALAVGWFATALLMLVSIIGIPWARAAFNIGLFVLWPFGSVAVDRRMIYGEEDIGTGPLGFLGNVIWFVFCGWWLALSHLVVGLGWCLTIIGIPFGFQHFKIAGLALAPIGKAIVPADSLNGRYP